MPSRESRLSTRLRTALRDLGVLVTQVIDAGIPGPSDLILEWFSAPSLTPHFVWLELKAGSDPRPEQITFLQVRYARFRSAYILDLGSDGLLRLFRGSDAAPKLDPATTIATLSSLASARVLLSAIEFDRSSTAPAS